MRTGNNPEYQYEDYAFIVKTESESGNPVLLIGDLHSSGILGGLRMLKEKEFLKKINQKYGYFPKLFEMIIKVKGYGYSNIEKELVYFDEL